MIRRLGLFSYVCYHDQQDISLYSLSIFLESVSAKSSRNSCESQITSDAQPVDMEQQ